MDTITMDNAELQSGTPNIRSSNGEKQLEYISLLKDKLKFRILMLLLTHGELNITEISNTLHKSKSTISRHLAEMEGVIVDCKEAFKDQEIAGRITPKYYRISEEFKKKVTAVEANYAAGTEGQMKFYHDLIELLRTGVDISKENFDMIHDMTDYLESQMDDPEKARQVFDSYVFGQDFYMEICYLNEAQYRQFLEFLSELRQKAASLREVSPDEKKPYVFIGSLVNYGKMLELQGRMNERKMGKK
ncbi:hypothetical protein CUJ83_08475 [Methanocella sp. CWC-04]|uniref:HTH arsR-type domain-containing protein n=1 Tax=Methanooceanicella nereidis TaxID=2052831 RepID=A0AAP2RF89_9EURY|nr:winged helix-turn-helix domain-containing protein [Methanocella sp. CWC-04]MCD1295030.1 hypothetical protein [Methanocella sp. CWC-04]